MVLRAIAAGLAALAILVVAVFAYVRFELRPRPERLDAGATGLPVEAVVIASESGSRLAGWYLRGSGSGAVLLLHGAKSNRLVQIERIRRLHEAGYSVLAIDFQAHGESPGDRITFGARESLDARAALAWLRARNPGERVAVLGISMGGAAILIGDPIRADAVVLESAFPDLAAGLTRRLWDSIGPPARIIAPLLFLAMRAAGTDPWKLRPVDGIGRLHVPIFVMSGAEDRKVSLAESRTLFDAANPPKSFWAVPDAGHIDLAAAGGEAYWQKLLPFLDSALRRGDPAVEKAR
jgi:fermentation-respiration switch protein FrsA (DUF1100 family)